MSPKLCFAGADQLRALRPDAGPRKQSFQDKGVPKLELGHEGLKARQIIHGWPATISLSGVPDGRSPQMRLARARKSGSSGFALGTRVAVTAPLQKISSRSPRAMAWSRIAGSRWMSSRVAVMARIRAVDAKPASPSRSAPTSSGTSARRRGGKAIFAH